ncbi:MAG: AMP-binding protein, partial [Algicola sp.]|nr:AMP-binding protein [Algicola sp.]
VVAKPEGHKDPLYLTNLIRQCNVTTLHFVPSMLRLMLAQPQWSQCTSIRHLFCSGEALPADVVTQHYQLNSAPLHNLYGPTEAAIDVSFWPCPPGVLSTVPIGKPIQNIALYVLNSAGQLVPQGAVGELHIAGVGLARGYLNRPDLTAQKFIANPFAAVGSQNDRLYKTGDLARYLPDGNIEYCGRIDNQVKIRGFRIELGEIEYQLGQCAGVDSAVVIARDSAAGAKQLVAYIKEAEPITIDTANLATVFKQTLAKSLPEYMVPTAFVFIKQWPLSANGKLDKKALPSPDDSQQLADFAAPTSQTELNLVNIWAKLLKIDADNLGINANFFALGGDSILSIQLVSRAARQDMAFTVKQLFEYQTIETLARFVESQTQHIIDTPQGQVNGELALLPIAHRFFSDPTDLHHYNQSVMLTTPESFDSTWLSTIVEQLYLRHDALRLRFESKEGQWRASHQQLDPAMISQSIELSGERVTDLSAVDDYQASLSLSAGPLFKAVYFAPDNRLLLIIHHLVVDGVSWRILLEDIESICADLSQNKTPILPAKTASYQQWGDWLTDYAASDALLAERDYWLDVVTKIVPDLPCERPTDEGIKLPKNQSKTHFELDQITTEQLLQQAGQAYRTQINELLLAGLLLGMNRWSGNEAIRIDLEGHGRQTLDLSQTVGWFTSVYPLVLNCAAQDLESVICAVKAQYRAMPNDGIGYGILKYLTKDEALNKGLSNAQQADILFNYLGQFDEVFGDDNYLKASTDGTGQTVSPRRKPSHGLEFNGMVSEGKLHFDLSFDANRFTAQAIDTLAGHIQDALNAVVSHCLEPNVGRLTPCDFPQAQINQQQLTHLAADYAIEDIYPATAMQQGLLFHSDIDSSAYVNQLLLSINDGTSGSLDSQKYRQAWQQVMALHEIFNTAFVDGNQHQLVLRGVELPWYQQDLSDLSIDEQQQTIEQYRQQDKAAGFDVSKAPLTRVALFCLGKDHWQVLWTHHHALIDGWCLPLLLEQVAASYQGLPLTKPTAYRHHVNWLASQDTQAAQDFWQQQLADIEQPTPLPEGKSLNKSGVQTTELTLTQVQTTQLTQLARDTQTTVNVVMQAAWGYLLSA